MCVVCSDMVFYNMVVTSGFEVIVAFLNQSFLPPLTSGINKAISAQIANNNTMYLNDAFQETQGHLTV